MGFGRKLRREVLSEIRGRLKDKESCRVISTQLVEAGVDIDLPVVYRAPVGFDSIAQAAGRCNREGKLLDESGRLELGRVYMFEKGGNELAAEHPEPLSPVAVEAYFKLLYWSRSHEWDRHGVMPCFEYNPRDKAHAKLAAFISKTAAAAYRIIRDEQTPVLVSDNDEAQGMVEYVMVEYVVSGQPIDAGFFLLGRIMENRVLVQHLEAGLWALVSEAAYSKELGLLPEAAGISSGITHAVKVV